MFHKEDKGNVKVPLPPLRSTKGERSEPVSVAKRGAGGKGDVFPYIHHFIEFISWFLKMKYFCFLKNSPPLFQKLQILLLLLLQILL